MWTRFHNGASVEQIAKALGIKPRTVFNYLLSALTQGRALDLQRLADECAACDCADHCEIVVCSMQYTKSRRRLLDD